MHHQAAAEERRGQVAGPGGCRERTAHFQSASRVKSLSLAFEPHFSRLKFKLTASRVFL